MHKNSFLQLEDFYFIFFTFKPIIYITVGTKAKKQSGIGLLKVFREICDLNFLKHAMQ